MQNWEYKKLGDIAEIFNGNSINADEKKAKYTDLEEGYPYIATKDVGFDNIVDYDNGIKIPFNDSSFKIARSNSVFVCAEGGSAGKKVAFIEQDVCFGNKLFAIYPKDFEKINSRFIYLYVQSDSFVNSFKKLLTGIIGGVSQKKFANIEILLPPLDEQKRIVKILDEKFAMLETVKANAKANLQNAKDLFQSQLTKAFSNTTWEKKKLDTIANIKSGFAFKSSAFKTEGEYQVLRLGNVKQNYLRVEEKSIFVSDISDSDFSKAKVNVGDLVVTQTGTKGKRDYGFVAIVDRDNLLLNQRLAAITTGVNLYNRYLLYFSYTESFKDQFFANEGGTVGQGNIGLTDIKEIQVPVPPLPEQKRIVEQLDSLSEKVHSLEEIYTKQLANCDELKQAFLAKAFNGEL